MHYIKLEEAGKRYLAKRFNLTIQENEFWVISGANGSGKTTLLLMILGFIRPDVGLIDKKKLKIGYLPEKMMLPPFIKAFDYLETMARIKKDQVNMDYIYRLEVPLNASIYELSKGNQQKLGILQAFMGHPKLIVLDEPFSGLDEKSAEIVVDILEEIMQEGVSFLISTHQPERFRHLWTEHIEL
jgi:ABC-2 type transport system ATP-binding protein